MTYSLHVAACQSYTEGVVQDAISSILEILNAENVFVTRGDAILVKPNASMPRPPETNCCTHPTILRAVLAWICDLGAQPVVVESSCIGTPKGTEQALRFSGIYEAAESCGVQVVNLDAITQDDAPCGISSSQKWVRDNGSCVVSVGKCKMHSMLGFTGCVKNCFGLIPGRRKPLIHSEHPDPYDFSAHLLDYFVGLPRVVGVIDAVEAMQGNGPTHGSPLALGLVGGSHTPIGLDALFATLLALPVADLPFFRQAQDVEPGWPELVVETMRQKAFRPLDEVRLPATISQCNTLRTDELRGIYNRGKPKFCWTRFSCVGCGNCVRQCPVDALELEDARLIYREEACVKCLCCQEVCEYGAILFSRAGAR